MDRKKIAALPHGEAEETGKWVKAYIVDDTLILDCFESRNYIGRYCLQETGRYDFFHEKDRKWKKWRIETAYGNQWYYGTGIKGNKETQTIIGKFIHIDGHFESGISFMESCYNGDRREAARLRKKERIKEMMDGVPILTNGFYDWLNGTVFGGKEYMFKTSPTTWQCTACGKVHTAKKPYKNNQILTCSRTKKEVTVKNRNQMIKKRVPVMVLQTMKDGRAVARHFVAERICSDQGARTEVYENIRYLIGKMNDSYPTVVWYYGQKNDADELNQTWWDKNPKNARCNREYLFPVGVKEALENTVYEKIRLEEFADLGWKLQYNKMMINYNTCGFMEYMAKSGMRKMTEETSEILSSWVGFNRDERINAYGNNAAEVLGIDMQRFHRLRQHDGGYRYLNWLRDEIKEGRNLPEKTIGFLDKNGIDPGDIAFIRHRMTPVQVANYLERQAKISKKTPHSLLGYWKDYLSMAKRMELDVDDEIVYRTKNLLLRHDEILEMINSMNEDDAATKMNEKYPDVEKILGEIKERYEYENEEYRLVVPTKIREIMQDSRQLHHCAGASERYYDRISNRETYIMFLRKKSRPLYAWYTMEVEPGGTVRQKRSEYNRQPDIKEVEGFIAEWQKILKSRINQEDKKLAAQSRELRISEMQQLKKTNERFAGVLEADLMEVG